MKQFAIKVHGTFNGIYEWGKGFKDEETMKKWNWFWKVEFSKKKGLSRLFWKYAEGDDYADCGFLSSLTGSIYMHPMEFKSVLVTSGSCPCVYSDENGKEYFNNFQSELRELKEICDECAEFCDGTFDLKISKEFVIETPELDELTDFDDDEYPQKFGMEKS